MVNEESDFYLLIDDQWTFYGPARISSLFHKKNNKWKVIHQHGSFPDSKTEEGEQVNTEKIKAENIQLRDAVKRRTLELENKNRELEIEAALERVRTVAMSMRKPEELAAVSEIIFTELKSLGFADIRNTEIIINKNKKNTITSYYYSDYGVTGAIDVDTTTHPTIKDWAERLKKSSDSFVANHISEKEMKDWRKYRESLGYLPDVKLNKVKTVEYYSYSIGLGALSISSFKPINDEQLKTLKRFKNVFGLTYRRYADVAKAEAQAREAQIEASLERIRAKAMGMHHSDELSDVLSVLFQQYDLLGICPEFALINLFDLNKNTTTSITTGKGGQRIIAEQTVDLDAMDVWKEAVEEWKSHESMTVSCIYYPPEAVTQLFELFQELRSAIPEELRTYPEDFPA